MLKLGCFSSIDKDKDNLALYSKYKILDDKDIHRIRTSWNSIQDIREFGITVMIRIFVNYPHLKHMWKFAEPLITEAEMRSNSQLRFHANRVASTIAKIVENLTPTLDACIDDIRKLGHAHSLHNVQPEHLKVFQEVLLFALEKSFNSSENTTKHSFKKSTKQSWIKLCSILFANFCKGLINGCEF
jgi:hemoglobin-like flavoprotein